MRQGSKPARAETPEGGSVHESPARGLAARAPHFAQSKVGGLLELSAFGGFIRNRPAHCLYEYLVSTPDDVRIAAVKNFSDGSERLRQRIEDRRRQHANESLSLRRKIHSAILLTNEIELIIGFANKAGIPWKTVADIGSTNARRIINDVPTYYIEREMALRLEAQTRPIEENDFRDMQSFCAIIPYADEVVGENQFVNLAQQAKLDRKYGTRITTKILGLRESLEQLKSSAC